VYCDGFEGDCVSEGEGVISGDGTKDVEGEGDGIFSVTSGSTDVVGDSENPGDITSVLFSQEFKHKAVIIIITNKNV